MPNGWFTRKQKSKFTLGFLGISLFYSFFYGSLVLADPFEIPDSHHAFEDISHVLTTFFPKSEGEIAFRERDRLILNLGGNTHAVAGILFSVLHPGDPFFHPLTQEIMGYSEQEIGTIQLVETGGESITGKVVQEYDPIQVGDKFRLSGVKLPLALITQTDLDQELFGKKLAMALEETGRFMVIETLRAPTLADSLQGEGNPLDTLSLNHFGENFNVHYLILLKSKLAYPNVEVDLQMVVVPWNTQIAKMTVLMKLSEEDQFILSENGMIQTN